MRKPRFRVWSKRYNSFLYDETLYEFMNSDNVAVDCYASSFHVGCAKNEELQQFTGFTDKNGEDIFEGDIIQLEGAPYKYVIIWDDWKWGIDSKGVVSEHIQGFTPAVRNRTIVVGNIFENPELLEKETLKTH